MMVHVGVGEERPVRLLNGRMVDGTVKRDVGVGVGFWPRHSDSLPRWALPQVPVMLLMRKYFVRCQTNGFWAVGYDSGGVNDDEERRRRAN